MSHCHTFEVYVIIIEVIVPPDLNRYLKILRKIALFLHSRYYTDDVEKHTESFLLLWGNVCILYSKKALLISVQFANVLAWRTAQ